MFQLELPGLGMEVVLRELLFSLVEGGGLLLLPSSSGCVPPSTSLSLSLVSHQYGPNQLCWDSR